MSRYFPEIEAISVVGPESDAALGFRYYNATQLVAGKTMEEHLRPAVCFWHSLCWQGADVFGANTWQRSWLQAGSGDEGMRAKIDAGFEFITKLGVPFFTFHDRDIAPEGANLRESDYLLSKAVAYIGEKIQQSGKRLLWGTANLFAHPRFRAGAATSPDPDIFAIACAQVKSALEATHTLGGENYVLWGGREGYDTLLNTDLRQENQQRARFLSMLVEHKYKIGFKGTLLIEPKPCEPLKHHYDFDVAHVYAFLRHYGLEKEFKVNIEANHATLAGHTLSHEIAYAQAYDMFGSIDMNQGDAQLGWDTDQFPSDLGETTRALYEIVRGGGFTSGGFNFDAKLRRQSTELRDLFVAHIAGLDTLARGLLAAEKLLKQADIGVVREQRYKRWQDQQGQAILMGKYDLAGLAAYAYELSHEPELASGRQELLEHRVVCSLQ
jgi:xylose isomerase